MRYYYVNKKEGVAFGPFPSEVEAKEKAYFYKSVDARDKAVKKGALILHILEGVHGFDDERDIEEDLFPASQIPVHRSWASIKDRDRVREKDFEHAKVKGRGFHRVIGTHPVHLCATCKKDNTVLYVYEDEPDDVHESLYCGEKGCGEKVINPRPEHRRAFDKKTVCPTEVHEKMKANPDIWNRLELLARHEGLEYRHCDKCPSTLTKFDESLEPDYNRNPEKAQRCRCDCGCRNIGNVKETGWCRDCYAGDCPGDEPEMEYDADEDQWVKKKNPDAPEPPQLSKAVGKFEEFHKHSAKGYGPFSSNLKIPDTISFMGEAVYVAYNSNKWGEKASYIHHHDCGNCSHEREDHYDDEPYPCEKWGCNCKRFRSNVKFFMPSSGGQRVEVPSFIKSARTLTRLGKCLEFCYIGSDGNFKEHKSGSGYELFCIPSGKALLIIADKSRLVAMVWGGKLNVKDVGIVG